MSQGPTPQPGLVRRDEIEISLAEVLAPLRRRWKLILVGTAASWAAIALALLITPPRYRCEATLVVPDAFPPPDDAPQEASPGGRDPLRWEPTKERRRVGIPIGLYKKLASTLSDGSLMQAAFLGKLAPGAVEQLRRKLKDHVSPITSVGKDDVEKLARDDTITAIQVSYDSASADHSRATVDTLASLVRGALVHHVAADLIEWDTVVSEEKILDLVERRTALRRENRSLETLVADLERLARGAREGAAAGREVVDTREGGHRFLSPALQLVGAKASRAENEHSIRMYEEALALDVLRLRFYARLRGRMAEAVAFVPDLPQALEGELEAFLREEGGGSDALRSVEADMKALRDRLAALRTRSSFIQSPTTWAKPRAPWAVALASLALLLFVAAAFLADLWQRSGAGQAGDRVSGPGEA